MTDEISQRPMPIKRHPMMAEDWSLDEQAKVVARAKKGDQKAQERIYRLYAQRVFNLAYRMVLFI